MSASETATALENAYYMAPKLHFAVSEHFRLVWSHYLIIYDRLLKQYQYLISINAD